MPAYATVQLVMKDMEAFAKYREKAGEALAMHGGKVIAGGPNSEVLEDTGAGECVMVLLEFADADGARGLLPPRRSSRPPRRGRVDVRARVRGARRLRRASRGAGARYRGDIGEI